MSFWQFCFRWESYFNHILTIKHPSSADETRCFSSCSHQWSDPYSKLAPRTASSDYIKRKNVQKGTAPEGFSKEGNPHNQALKADDFDSSEFLNKFKEVPSMYFKRLSLIGCLWKSTGRSRQRTAGLFNRHRGSHTVNQEQQGPTENHAVGADRKFEALEAEDKD